MSLQRQTYFSVSSVGVPIRNTADYSPFGVQLDGRTIQGDFYRYGFQNQEKDDEIKGVGNSMNYTYRMHDPRVGRFFAVDPLARKYPWNSTYAFSENILICAVELEGLEAQWLLELLGAKSTNTGSSKLIITADIDVYNYSKENLIANGYDIIYMPANGENPNGDEYVQYSISFTAYNNLTKSYMEEHGLKELDFLCINGHGSKNGISMEAYDAKGNSIKLNSQSFESENMTTNNSFNENVNAFIEMVSEIKNGGVFVIAHCQIGQDENLGKEILNRVDNEINIYTNKDNCEIGNIYNKSLTSICAFKNGWIKTNENGIESINNSIKITKEKIEQSNPSDKCADQN